MYCSKFGKVTILQSPRSHLTNTLLVNQIIIISPTPWKITMDKYGSNFQWEILLGISFAKNKQNNPDSKVLDSNKPSRELTYPPPKGLNRWRFNPVQGGSHDSLFRVRDDKPSWTWTNIFASTEQGPTCCLPTSWGVPGTQKQRHLQSTCGGG